MELTKKLSYLTLEHSPVCLVYIELNGICHYANLSASNFFGKNQDQIVSTHLHDLVHPHSSDHHRDQCPLLKPILLGETIFRQPTTFTNAAGETVWVEMDLTPIRENNSILGFALSFIDASLAYRSLTEYTNIRAIFKSVFEAVSDPILILDNSGRIIEANLASRHFFDQTNLPQKPFFRLFPQESRFAIRNFWNNLHKLNIFRSIVSIANLKESNIYLELSGQAHIQPDIHLVIMRDISRDIMEKQERDQFAAIISHEIKNPLAVIKAFTQLLQRRLKKHPDPSVDQYLDRIDDKVNFIAGLITNLTDALRLGTGQLNFNDEMLDFDQQVKSIVLEHQKTSPTHKIILKGSTGKQISIDPHRLNQMISNLITNAIKYSPDADRVLISLSLWHDYIQLKIKDYGIGIEPHSRPSLYQPFYRGSNVDHRFPGLGLGLYLTKSIISRYNGRLLYKSILGQGSTFILRLPATT